MLPHLTLIVPGIKALFANGSMHDEHLLHGSYDYTVVFLSVLVACIAALIALIAIQHAKDSRARRDKTMWIVSSALIVGGGVWCMHFLGMLAHDLPIDVRYDILLTGLSIIPGMMSGGIVAHFALRQNRSLLSKITHSIGVGGGIGLMHFTGMAAMKMEAVVQYDALRFALSILVPVAASFIALTVLASLSHQRDLGRRRLGMTLSAIALGLAVSSMHYTAMSASIFVASAQTHAISFLVDGVYLLLPIVSFLSILTVLTVFIAPFRHRLLNAQILAAYFEKSSDGIVVADHNGTILEFNPAACQLFGYSADEIIGKNVAILVPDEDRTSHEQHVSSFVPQGDSDVLGMKRELVAQRKDGSRFAVKIFLSSASAGGAITLIATIHDVSKEKQLRDAQDRANSALQEALEHQTEQTEKQKRFVSMVSHEFRTPLAIIDGNARRIQKKVGAMSEDQVVERTAKIQAAVARMTGLMESNLMRGRNESAAMGLDLVWLDPAELVSDACIEQAELCADHEIVFDPGTLPHKALVDLSGIRQVLNNLLSNAAKYSPGCGTIHVSGHSDSGQLFIDVKDYGVGIPQAELPLLFGEYFRASTASGIAGTGLGLALSREIARAHDGDITVDCKSGESTTFTLSLPIEGPAASSSECRDGTDWGS